MTRSKSKNDQYLKLLSKFKDITFDTFLINSLGDNVNFEKYEFKGVQLDSLDIILFPQKIAHAHFVDPPGLFACYKFKIDSARTALITRTPSEYFPSSIKLFVYTQKKDTLIETVELAESIGDEGVSRDINSWIFKDKNNIKSFIWARDIDDHSIGNEDKTDTAKVISDNFTIYDISKDQFSSLGDKIENLPFGYRRLISKKSVANKSINSVQH